MYDEDYHVGTLTLAWGDFTGASHPDFSLPLAKSCIRLCTPTIHISPVLAALDVNAMSGAAELIGIRAELCTESRGENRGGWDSVQLGPILPAGPRV